MNEEILQAMSKGDVAWLRQHLGHVGARFTFFKEEQSPVPTYFHAAWNSPNPDVLLEFLNKSRSSKDSWFASQGRWAFDTVKFLEIFNGWGTFSPRGLMIPSVSEMLLTADYTNSDVRKKATAFIQFMSRNVKNIDGLYEYQSYVDSYVKLFKDILRKLLLEGTPKQIKQTIMTDMPQFLNFFDPTISDLTKTLTIREEVKSQVESINLSLLVNLIYQDALSQLGEDFVKQWDQNYESIVDLLEKHEVLSVIDGVDAVWPFGEKTSFPAKYIFPLLRKLESAVKPGKWNFVLQVVALRFARSGDLDAAYKISQFSDDFFILGFLHNVDYELWPINNDLIKKFYKDCLKKHTLSDVVSMIFNLKEHLSPVVEWLESHGVMLRQDIKTEKIDVSKYVNQRQDLDGEDKEVLLQFFRQVPDAAPEVVEEEALPPYSAFDTEEKRQEWSLEEENAVLKEELAAAHEQIHSLEEQLKGEGKRVRLLEEELAASQQAQAARKGLSRYAEKRVVEANAEIAQLRQEKVVSEAKIARVQSEYEAQAKTISDLEQKNVAAEEKIEAMQGLASRSESAEQHAAKLEGIVAEQQKTIAELARKHADEMKAMQREMARLKAQLSKSQQSAVQKAPAAKPASVHPGSPLLRSHFPGVPTGEPGAEVSTPEPAEKSRSARRRAARKGPAQLNPHE